MMAWLLKNPFNWDFMGGKVEHLVHHNMLAYDASI